LLTNIGMAAGADAAKRILERDVDWVMVVGVAGGVDHQGITIGDVVVPEVVLDRATGRTFRPTPVGDIAPRGIVSCGDDLITDPDAIGKMEQDGVVAVEMESAAVAPVCEDAGVAWSVFRGISDFADAGLVDDALFAMTNADGSADPDAMKRYLTENPERAQVLVQLGHDTTLAVNNAAAAAIRACAALPPR
jgi:nucleoside phosphorylase